MSWLNNLAHSVALRNWVEKNFILPVRSWKKLTASSSFHAELLRLAQKDAAEYAYTHFHSASYVSTKKDLYDFLESYLSVVSGLYLEFGVYKADSLNYFASKFPEKIWHGFDSFEGLPSTWSGSAMPKGAFSLAGKLPSVQKNVQLHKGWFSDTLPPFIERQQTAVGFIHFDADLYSSTNQVLEILTPYIKQGSLFLFDEYFGHMSWRNHEHKAFTEWVAKNNVSYTPLVYSSSGALLVRITSL